MSGGGHGATGKSLRRQDGQTVVTETRLFAWNVAVIAGQIERQPRNLVQAAARGWAIVLLTPQPKLQISLAETRAKRAVKFDSYIKR